VSSHTTDASSHHHPPFADAAEPAPEAAAAAPAEEDNEGSTAEVGADGLTKNQRKRLKEKEKKKAGKIKIQTTPPSVPVFELYPLGEFPVGEEMEYKNSVGKQEYEEDNTYRTTDAECRERERLTKPTYEIMRHASEVHRQVRKFAYSIIKPGGTMSRPPCLHPLPQVRTAPLARPTVLRRTRLSACRSLSSECAAIRIS